MDDGRSSRCGRLRFGRREDSGGVVLSWSGSEQTAQERLAVAGFRSRRRGRVDVRGREGRLGLALRGRLERGEDRRLLALLVRARGRRCRRQRWKGRSRHAALGRRFGRGRSARIAVLSTDDRFANDGLLWPLALEVGHQARGLARSSTALAPTAAAALSDDRPEIDELLVAVVEEHALSRRLVGQGIGDLACSGKTKSI